MVVGLKCVVCISPFLSDTNCTLSTTDTDEVTTVLSPDEPRTSGKMIFTTNDQENSITSVNTAVLEGTNSRFQHINVCGEGRLSFMFIYS